MVVSAFLLYFPLIRADSPIAVEGQPPFFNNVGNGCILRNAREGPADPGRDTLLCAVAC